MPPPESLPTAGISRVFLLFALFLFWFSAYCFLFVNAVSWHPPKICWLSRLVICVFYFALAASLSGFRLMILQSVSEFYSFFGGLGVGNQHPLCGVRAWQQTSSFRVYLFHSIIQAVPVHMQVRTKSKPHARPTRAKHIAATRGPGPKPEALTRGDWPKAAPPQSRQGGR